MTASARDWEPAAEHRWETALHGLRADALDCMQTTLALVADHANGAGAHLVLGCRWRFPDEHPDGGVRVQPSLPDRLADAVELLGLRIGTPRGPIGVPELRRWLADTETLYVVADAYDLPWVPYAGQRHMPHSFLLALAPARRGYTVVDAYHNDTEWGPARPGAWTLSTDSLDRALRGGALATTVDAAASPPWVDRAAVLAGNAARAAAAAPDIERYACAVRAELDRPEVIERLVLDIWTLGRERLLHTAWLGDHPAATETGAAAAAWQQLAGQSYLAMRRFRSRGGPVASAVVADLVKLLHSDAALVARLAATPTATPAATPAVASDAVLGVVLDALRRTLVLDDRAIHHTDPLRALPGFNSFRLVEIIDRIECRLGVQLPADVSAEDLQDVAGLCRLFAGTAAVAAASRAGR